MEGAVAIRKFSIRSIAVTVAALLAVGAGGTGYWLLTSASSHPTQVKVIPLRPATATRHAAAERAEADQTAASGLAAQPSVYEQGGRPPVVYEDGQSR